MSDDMNFEEDELLKDAGIGKEIRKCLEDSDWSVMDFSQDEETGKWSLEMEHEGKETGTQIVLTDEDVSEDSEPERAFYKCVKQISDHFDAREYAMECFDYDFDRDCIDAEEEEIEIMERCFSEEVEEDLWGLEADLKECLFIQENE